jgi:4-hydroxythreonine-4-phosphate dehydrogenase
MKPLLAITLGDTNGVGPEILVKALARPKPWEICHPFVVGSAPVFEEVRRWSPRCPPARRCHSIAEARMGGTFTPIMEGGLDAPVYDPGQLDPAAGKCAVEWVKLAVKLALDKQIDGIVTCPINKEGVHKAGYTFAGHTDLIAEMCGAPDYRMCLFAGAMRVVHNSAHVSLREAIDLVTTERVAASIRIAHDGLLRLRTPRKRIAVAALNPHAGEAGAFGTEDAEIIAPAVAQCRQHGIACSGPYPADTVFRRMQQGEFDLVVAMYHDQGHAPMKLIAMDDGVNVTLGIPIVRTSVDHGTAYDIAGTGVAHEQSLLAAISLAAEMAATHNAGETPAPQ